MRKKVIALTLAGGLALSASAQTVFVNGGSVFNEQSPSMLRGNYSSLQIGLRAFVVRSFELQGGVTVLSEPSVDAALRFRPFRSLKLEPYAFTGFGYLFASDDFRSVVPAGLGVGYSIDDQWGVHAEVAAVWTLSRDPVGGKVGTMVGVSPVLGVSYRLNRALLARPPRTLARRDDAVDGARTSVDSYREQPAPPDLDRKRGTVALPATPPSTLARGTAVIDERMTVVPDGMFIMGLADEDPLSLQTAGFKRITVTGFAIDRYEATNSEYIEFMNASGRTDGVSLTPDSTVWEEAGFRFSFSSYFRGERYRDYPVVAIDYDQAAAYCSAQGKRLPTEAEWEYAARSGREGGIFPWNGFEARNYRGEYMGNYNNGRAGYAADGYAFTAPVYAYSPNEWGLFNMSGNVAEWVEDAYSATYLVLSDFNPYHIDEAENRRVVRGGSWASDEFYIGVGVRDAQGRNEASPYVGVRCAMDLSDELFVTRSTRASEAGTGLPEARDSN